MASKRKKSRPTRIQETCENYEDSIDEDFMLKTSPVEDSSRRIQRFLEEESVDTPEHVQLAITQSPVSQMFGVNSERGVKGRPADCATDAYPETDGVVDLSGALHFQQIIRENIPVRSPNDAVSLPAINTPVMNRAKTKQNPPSKTTSDSASKRKRRHKDDPPRYSCSTCKYETNRSDHFKRHLMTHSDDKPLKCTTCGYSTGRSDHYKRHLQRHGMTDQQVIEICEKNGLKLKNAQQALSEEDKLAKENGQQSAVSKDKKTPKVTKKSGSKYVCEECGYATDKSSHYHRHVRSHTTERPYTCDTCQKSFKLPLYLSKHRCSRLSKRTCPSCKSIFISRDALLEHHTNEHPQADLPDGLLDENEEDDPGEEGSESIERTEDDPGAGSKVNGSVPDGMDQGNFFKNFTQMASEIINNKILPKKDETSKKEDAVTSNAVKEENPDPSALQDCTVTKGVNREGDGKSPNMQLPMIIVPLEDYLPSGDRSPTSEPNAEDSLLPLSRISVKSVLPPLVPSENKLRMGTLKCTKCETWFAKLDDYSTHNCT